MKPRTSLGSEHPIIYANKRSMEEQDGPNALFSLLVALPELRCTSTALMNILSFSIGFV